MAASQFVIAGRADCERYARLEAAADYFQSRLPGFRVHKEPRTPLEWPCFLRRTCAAQGWHLPVDEDAPLVWRLLVQRGGRGLLIGGLSEFLQLAAVYYGLSPPELSPLAARQMAAHTAAQLELERKQRRQARVALERRLTVVAVLGSPLCHAAYHFLAALATGSVLGADVPLRLQLLGEPADPALAALRRELHDLASEQLGQVALLPSAREAVRDASVIIVIDPIPNVLPPETPEPTPPPTPPPEEPPPPPPQPAPAPTDRPRSAGDERSSSSEAETAASTPPGSESGVTSPTITTTPPDEDRIPGDLTPTRGRGASARRSAESRKLSIIVEDPDSEEKEEEAMEQLMASRGASSGSSGRRRSSSRYRSPTGSSSQQRRSSRAASDAGDVTGGGKAKTSPSGGPAGSTSVAGGAAATGARGSVSGGGADGSSDQEMGADGWLEPPSDIDDDDGSECGVTQDDLADLFCRMRGYACAIEETAARRCRVVVAGGRVPCLAATMILLHLPRLPRTNVIAVCQPRTNQLRALVAERLGVAPHDVHGLVEWGNPPAGRTWLDLDAAAVSGHQGAVRGPPGYRRPLLEVLHQRRWADEELPRLLAERAGSPLLPAGAEVSALPLAVSLADTLRRWWAGSDDGRLDSLGVASEGEFGVPVQLVLAAPVRLIAGDFRVCRTTPLYGEGAAAVRAAVSQAVGWLWRFGVRLTASGHQCTLSACPSSTVTCCGSGERISSDAERAAESDGKGADSADSAPGAEGDGGGALTESGEQPPQEDATDVARPQTANGERTAISGGEEPPQAPPTGDPALPPPVEQTSPAPGAPSPAPPSPRRPSAPVANENSPTPADNPAATPSPDPRGTSDGSSSSAEPASRRISLTAEGERGYIPVQDDQ